MRSIPKEVDLGKDPVGRLLFTLAAPAITSQVVNALFIAVGSSFYGFLVQISRCMAFRLPMAWFLAATVSMSWVWLFQPLSFICAALLTWFFALRLMNKLKNELGGAPLPPNAGTGARG